MPLPRRIGGPEEEKKPGIDEATKEIMSAIQDRSELRLKSALEAFFLAVDAEPHSEGEHEGEEE